VGQRWSRGKDVAGALLEVCKYVTKGLGKLTDEQSYEVYVSCFGRRLISHWGMGNDSLLDTQETIVVCAICGESLRYEGRMDGGAWKDYYGQYKTCPVRYLDDG